MDDCPAAAGAWLDGFRMDVSAQEGGGWFPPPPPRVGGMIEVLVPASGHIPPPPPECVLGFAPPEAAGSGDTVRQERPD